MNNDVDNSTTYLKPFLLSDKALINVSVFKDGKIIDGTQNSIQIYKVEHEFSTRDELERYMKSEIPKRGLDGDYNDIGLGQIKDLSNFFSSAYLALGQGDLVNNYGTFNGDISAWDTSKVTNMSWMFYEATSFNQDLSNWNPIKIGIMSYMFANSKYARSLVAWEDKLPDRVDHNDINKNTPTLKNSMLPSQLKD